MYMETPFSSGKLLKKYLILLVIVISLFLPCLFFCHLDKIVTVSGEIRPETSEASIIPLIYRRVFMKLLLLLIDYLKFYTMTLL